MDGDTDVPSVQQDFAAALYQLMRMARRKEEENLHDPDFPEIKNQPNRVHATNNHQNGHAIPNGVAKQIASDVSNHTRKMINTTKNVNGIAAQGNFECFYIHL